MFDFLKNNMIDKLNKEIDSLRLSIRRISKDLEEWRETALHWKRKHNALLKIHNSLIEDINRKGGMKFLDEARIPGIKQKNMFTESELKTLLILVHPDKHGKGRHGEMAEQLFKSINNMVK